MKNDILVTVITMSYNSFRTIMEAVDSLLMQDYGSIQYIITDDGSKEFDKQGLENYIAGNNHGNVKEALVLHNEKNKGTIRNINGVLDLVKGEYIFFLSADDCFYDSSVLSDWVREFIESGEEVITAKRAVYDSDMGTLLRIDPSESQIAAIKNLTPADLFEKMAASNFIFGCCTARKASNLREYGGYCEKYRLIEDYSANLQMLRNGQRIHFFDRTVIKYRTSGASSLSGLNKRYFKENRSLFRHEALPYVQDKQLAKIRYLSWEINVISGKISQWRTMIEQRGKPAGLRERFYYNIVLKLQVKAKRIKRNPKLLSKLFRTEKSMDIKKIEFSQHNDDRGNLTVAERGRELPFDVKRIYYIYGVDNSMRRGFHAHRNLQQVMVCVSGSCKVMFTDGVFKKDIALDNPNEAVYVGPGIWREMYDFSQDAVLLVLASEVYSEDDYIRDYDVFLEYVRKKS